MSESERTRDRRNERATFAAIITIGFPRQEREDYVAHPGASNKARGGYGAAT